MILTKYTNKEIFACSWEKIGITLRHKLPIAYKVVIATVFDSFMESLSSAEFKCVL